MKKRICLWLCILIMLMPLSLAETWQEGDESEEIADLQRQLIDTCFLSGTADGRFGYRTRAAVETLQAYLAEQGCGVRTDGVLDEETAAYLYDEDMLAGWYHAAPGDSGAKVKKIQERLIHLGYLTGKADGQYGEATEEAVLTFQKALARRGASLPQDGAADTLTWAYLFDTDLTPYQLRTPTTFDIHDPLSLVPDNLYCRSCLLVDADTGTVLFGKEPAMRVYPASTTKIMTLILALERVDLDASVVIPAAAEEIPDDSSRVPVYAGEEMTWRDLLMGLMIKSGNDAANAVAELLGGSVDGFVDMMNDKARELGMTDTHYVNPHGYHDDDHYTTAIDMLKLTRYALQNEDFREIVSTLEYTLPDTGRRKDNTIKNTYPILDPKSELYYSAAFGVKTGYTKAAGRCYVGAAEKDGHTLICAVFHSGSNTAYRYIDAIRMFRFGFAGLEM